MLCGLAALGFAIFWVILPETKGRSLEEMEVLFARPFTFPRSSCCGSSSDDGHSEASSAATKNVQYVQIRGLNRYQLDDEDD